MPAATPTSKLDRILRATLAVLAAIYAALFLGVALWRIGDPFELEWLEGDVFHLALRIRDGLVWYPKPSLEFFPNVYPPGYPALCAALMHVFGASLALMRAVSLASTLAAAALMVAIVRRATRGTLAGAVAAGLFLACFAACGEWYDLARVDMLALALALLGVHWLARDASAAAFAGGIAALTLAVIAKQSHLALLAGALAVWLVWNPRRALIAAPLAVLALAAAFVALQRHSDGWFSFYIYDLPRAAPFEWPRATVFLLHWLPRTLGLTAPIVAYAYARGAKQSLPLLLLPVAIVTSVSGWSLPGGYLNNAIPAVAFTALVAGIGVGRTASHEPRPPVTAMVARIALAALALEFVALHWDPRPAVPTRDEIAKGMDVVRTIAALPAPVLAPYNPYLLHLAGKPMTMQFHMLNELLQARDASPARAHTNQWAQALAVGDEVRNKLSLREYAAYIGIESTAGPITTDIDRMARPEYVFAGPLIDPTDTRTLYPLTGNRVRPGRVSVPRPEQPASP